MVVVPDQEGLYRTCVLPIATYGYRCWFWEGAHNVFALDQMRKMQRKAALWITGAFRTSPNRAVEALAGLQPIRLHLTKLASRSSLWLATLSASHPLRTLMGKKHGKGADQHRCSISSFKKGEAAAIKG